MQQQYVMSFLKVHSFTILCVQTSCVNVSFIWRGYELPYDDGEWMWEMCNHGRWDDDKSISWQVEKDGLIVNPLSIESHCEADPNSVIYLWIVLFGFRTVTFECGLSCFGVHLYYSKWLELFFHFSYQQWPSSCSGSFLNDISSSFRAISISAWIISWDAFSLLLVKPSIVDTNVSPKSF